MKQLLNGIQMSDMSVNQPLTNGGYLWLLLGLREKIQRHTRIINYEYLKRYIARNPRVLNGYSYQIFGQNAAQSGS